MPTCTSAVCHPSSLPAVLAFAVQVIKGFAAKSDGKDKLTALVQVCAILTATKPAAAAGAVFHNPAAE